MAYLECRRRSVLCLPGGCRSQRPHHVAAGAWHSFRRADARPLIPGEATEIKINLMPVSYLFRPGHRIRIALAGADKDHFDPLPGPSPEWHILRDGAHPSRVRLPVIRP